MYNTEYIFGTMAILVVIYRITFIMIPMASEAIADKNMVNLFKSFTLIV